MDPDSPWKQLRLSLERPYRDDNGNTIPVVEDITPEGEYIYETKENSSARLGTNLRRLFHERGVDFFDKISGNAFIPGSSESEDKSKLANALQTEDNDESQVMTYEDLRDMREEIMKNLAVSLGEMTHAQQVLAALLVTPKSDTTTQAPHQPPTIQPDPSQPQVKFAGTLVTKPPPITSVEAFNAQLTIGGKDEALRHAAGLFKESAESMERTRVAGEKYWVDALKIRRNNWRLVPAPLPLGSATGKGADKTSKDFLVFFGLEESPTQFRRRAVGQLATYSGPSNDMIFPHRRKARLCVNIITKDENGFQTTSIARLATEAETTLDGALKAAQREIVEQEIFSILVQEAGTLPTASAKVSERLIVVDAAQGLELQIELVDDKHMPTPTPQGDRNDLCDLIYHGLHLLLLRRHAHLKDERLDAKTTNTTTVTAVVVPSTSQNPAAPVLDKTKALKHPILQPIIHFLQFQVFLARIQNEMTQAACAIQTAGIPCTLLLNPVGETGKELVKLFDAKSNLAVGGEIMLRIFHRHTVRFTFVSPSMLTAHLSKATLSISSVPQLCQLLMDEVEQCLLKRIYDLGRSLSESENGTWFIELNRCVGRWEGCVLNFRVTFGQNYGIHCTAFFLGHSEKQGQSHHYPSQEYHDDFVDWAEHIIRSALKQVNNE